MHEFSLESTDAQVLRGTFDVNLTVARPLQNILTDREMDESKENRQDLGDAGYKYPSESLAYKIMFNLSSQQEQNEDIPRAQVEQKKFFILKYFRGLRV